MSNVISQAIEKTLKELDFGEDDILNQDLPSLELSLTRMTLLLNEPSNIFLERNIASLDANGGVVFHPLVYPLLLSRKQKILDRIDVLKRKAQYDEIENVVNSGESLNLIADKVKASIGNLRQEDISKLSDNLVDPLQLEQLYRAKAENFERKAQSIRSFLQQGTMTSILGFILLISLTVVETTAMFLNTPYIYKEKIDTVFLILFGYYFGSRDFKKNK